MLAITYILLHFRLHYRIEREKSRASNRMRPSFSRKKRQGSNVSMSGSVIHHEETRTADQSMKEMSIKLQNDVMSLRKSVLLYSYDFMFAPSPHSSKYVLLSIYRQRA